MEIPASHQLVEIRIPYLAATIASWLLHDDTLAKYIQHQPEIAVGEHFFPEAPSKIQKKVGHWLLTQLMFNIHPNIIREQLPNFGLEYSREMWFRVLRDWTHLFKGYDEHRQYGIDTAKTSKPYAEQADLIEALYHNVNQQIVDAVLREFGPEVQFFDHSNDTLLFLKSAVITVGDINQSLKQVCSGFPFDVQLQMRLISNHRVTSNVMRKIISQI